MKQILTLLLIFISAMARSQTAPTVYYQFDEVNPMAPTIGATNLNPNGGVYQIPNGPVGKYLAIETNAATYLRGQNINAGGAASVQMLFRKTYLMDAGDGCRLFTWGDLSASIKYPVIYFNTPGSGPSNSSMITFDGINQKSWGYLFDGNWHLLSFVYSGSIKQLWIDGHPTIINKIQPIFIVSNRSWV